MSKHERKWTDYAAAHLVGRRITGVGYMRSADAKDSAWFERPVAFMLDDGTVLYPVADEEGNGPGVLNGMTKDGEALLFPSLRVED